MTDLRPTSIALVGAAGRMGLEIIRAAFERNDLRIGAAIEHSNSPAIGKDAGELAGFEKSGVVINADLEQSLDSVDVVIDLSTAGTAQFVAETAAKKKVPFVCGTTGLDDDALKAIERAASEIAVLYTPNLSLGIAVTKQLVEQAVKTVGSGWDIEIVEMHHRNKVDAPSGTAMALAHTVAKAKKVSLETEGRFGRVGNTGERTGSEIGVHAIRGGGVFGWHKVILAGDHETIEISHRASSRALFAEGALRTALFLRNKPPGQYTMTDVLTCEPNK